MEISGSHTPPHTNNYRCQLEQLPAPCRRQIHKFLFQDDVLYPECIEKLVQEAEQDEQIGIVFCKRDLLVEDRSPETLEWANRIKDLQKADGFFSHSKRIKGTAILGAESLLDTPMNKIGEPTTVLFPRKVIHETGLFNEDMVQILDYEFLYRILKKYDVVMVDEPLAGFRVHPGQATMVNKDRDMEDYNIYFRLLYKNLFRQLHYKVRWRLFKKFNLWVNRAVRLKKELAGN